MFIGRENELQLLEDLYTSSKFEFLVLYGRRRVGKTSLLQEFSKGKKVIFFSAQEKNDSLNLTDFSKAIQQHFDSNHFGTFDGWENATEYISNRIGDERLLIIIDEFPFIASENPSIEASAEIMELDNIANFMGPVFEQICCQYMKRIARLRQLPFMPYFIGKWWSNNARKKRQDDVDVLLLDRKKESAVFCECKFRNMLFDKSEFEDLIAASEIFTQVKNKYYYIFSKSGFTEWVIHEAENLKNVKLLNIERV